jgi:hypothetical protein
MIMDSGNDDLSGKAFRKFSVLLSMTVEDSLMYPSR